MKYPIGQRLVLLENMKFNGGGQGQPMASAQVMDYNEGSGLYRISYQVYGSGEKGEIEVPEDRLSTPAHQPERTPEEW